MILKISQLFQEDAVYTDVQRLGGYVYGYVVQSIRLTKPGEPLRPAHAEHFPELAVVVVRLRLAAAYKDAGEVGEFFSSASVVSSALVAARTKSEIDGSSRMAFFPARVMS